MILIYIHLCCRKTPSQGNHWFQSDVKKPHCWQALLMRLRPLASPWWLCKSKQFSLITGPQLHLQTKWPGAWPGMPMAKLLGINSNLTRTKIQQKPWNAKKNGKFFWIFFESFRFTELETFSSSSHNNFSKPMGLGHIRAFGYCLRRNSTEAASSCCWFACLVNMPKRGNVGYVALYPAAKTSEKSEIWSLYWKLEVLHANDAHPTVVPFFLTFIHPNLIPSWTCHNFYHWTDPDSLAPATKYKKDYHQLKKNFWQILIYTSSFLVYSIPLIIHALIIM